MTDREKIIAEIERLKMNWRLGMSAEAKYRVEAYTELIDFINSLPEEPVSTVWHDASEEPKENTEIVFQWHSEDSGFKWMDVGFYNKDGNYIKTIGEQGENEIEMKFVTRWAKSEDLLKL